MGFKVLFKKNGLFKILLLAFVVCVYLVLNRSETTMLVPPHSNRRFIHIRFEVNNTRRLGNQIFAFASILGIAKEIGFEALYDEDTKLFDVFVAGSITRIPTQCSYCKYAPCDIIQQHEAYIYIHDEISRVVNNRRNTKNIQLKGYFLSWKYFQDIQEELRQNLQFREEILQEAQVVMNQNRLSYNGTIRRVGIHIRRGDMLVTSKVEFGYSMADMEYITRAMNYFTRKHKKSIIQFIVCSDNIEWAKQNMDTSNTYFSENHSSAVDLALLSLCDDIIMTTGTYGWWAGWLAQGEVIYFKHWYKPSSGLSEQSRPGDRDFMPTDWIGLS